MRQQKQKTPTGESEPHRRVKTFRTNRFAFSLIPLFIFAATKSSALNPESVKPSACQETSLSPVQGVALLIGGLNNKPEIMSDLGEELRADGYHTCMVRLSGHETGTDWPDLDYAEAWRSDVKQAALAAKAQYPHLRRIAVGYSLGATVALVVAGEDGDLFQSGIFFAPAIALKFHALLIRLTLPFRIFSWKLPSMAPEKWRAHEWTAILAYKGLFDLIEQISPEKIDLLPLCFIIDPKDELVSALNTARWISSNSLGYIHLIESTTDEPVRRHLLVDHSMRGEKSWQEIRKALRSCLP